jgi:hypothetical protein
MQILYTTHLKIFVHTIENMKKQHQKQPTTVVYKIKLKLK